MKLFWITISTLKIKTKNALTTMDECVEIGICNAVHLSSTAAHKRYSCRQLGLGYPAAHKWYHLMLLPSGPDMVHGYLLRRTQPSTLRARGRPNMRTASEKEFNLARADCKLQGTATSPSSTAILSILTKKKNCNEIH